MSAFNYDQVVALRRSATTLCRRVQNTHLPPAISPYDLVDMFAGPQWRQFLKRGSEIAHAARVYSSIPLAVGSVPTVVEFSLNNTAHSVPVFLPENPHLQPDADQLLVQNITDWAEFQYKTLYSFGVVEAFIERLNFICSSPEAVRYLWPSVLALAKVDSRLGELAQKIEEVKQPRNLPHIDPALRALCRETTTTVISATLLDAEERTREVEPVSVYLARYSEVHPVLGTIVVSE